jgi:hypothetical protein
MPAIPMAESKPPIVVGIRQINKAINTVMVMGVPCPATSTLNWEKGSNVMHTTKNMMVKLESKILKAISLGGF